MFIWLCVRWWYGAGWAYAWQRGVVARLEWCESTFSMGALLRTWFAPFKQTYSGNVKGSLGVHIRAGFDRFISRIIGFIVRSILLFAGLVCSVFVVLTGLIFILSWPLIPLLPAMGLVMWANGVGA
jgi:hypothetical protein